MKKINSWVNAARLRTLPLSISGILVGSTIAAQQGYFSLGIFSLALATTLGLQVLSNFANDYGDGVKGTDNDERIGPQRAIQSGLITHSEMKTGIILTSIITLILAVCLIYASFGRENFLYSLIFMVLGVASIVAAIKYTVGNSAYGYRGLGDIFVFIFFGIVAVFGSFFLYVNDFDWAVLMPAAAIGFLSAGVLNLNNMRDRVPDEKSGKMTLAVKLGEKGAKAYHYFLIIGAILLMAAYSALVFEGWDDIVFYLAFIPLVLHLKRVMQNESPALLDPELKVLALSTFALSLLFGLGQVF
ncbi:1,4-dihydroxy-2-naphthoate octaprenyltransferase [Zunongwangia sp. SCSIO 43204]|uniref:1,4-dihydroxy-2-naphthoate octaprenyltransferase n=1 Tax=Zunongwangia sp. SCSIO 43204 TaxID=2779359 RepID=UPI001CA97587|nr:1,4-dihydroxy-2-naphthoate octaprenyltransferase [Zunongwangia sp. SCSIO 43204]UAB86280.1 1,4-dihydroxy-2-naphthoate octaprenyltransferase [Zunongwangia sp. SCSIO 43204]